MKTSPAFLLAALALSMALTASRPANATAPAPAASTAQVAPAQPSAAPKKPHPLRIEISVGDKAGTTAEASKDEDQDADADADAGTGAGSTHAGHDNALVSFGHDSTLAAGEHAETVVSVLGSSTSAGQVDEAVVSVVGNTRVTGPVGEAAVAVMGNTYVDSHVGENVVAVFGNVELGPHAEVGGDVVAIGGELIRDPAAVVHGDVQNVMIFGKVAGFDWLRTWVHHCLMLGRPLAFAPGLGWAWTLALGFLGLYLLIALLFPQGVNNCVRTMETRPGRTVLASIFTFLCKPIVFLLLVVTVIGMILIPFLAFALFIAGLFGKAVALAWIGRRVLLAREGAPEPRPVLAVLIGGIIALLLYVVPVLGFITYKALDVLGLGIVVYTLILGVRASRAASNPPQAAPAPAAAPGESAATAAAPADAAATATATDTAAARAARACCARCADARRGPGGLARPCQSCGLLDPHGRVAARFHSGGNHFLHDQPAPPWPRLAADPGGLRRRDVEAPRHDHRRHRLRLACSAARRPSHRLADGSGTGTGSLPVDGGGRAGLYLGGVRFRAPVLARQDCRYGRGARAARHGAGLSAVGAATFYLRFWSNHRYP